MDELVREMTIPPQPDERDAVERAIRDLTAVGLLHHEGSFVVPTRAALDFHDL